MRFTLSPQPALSILSLCLCFAACNQPPHSTTPPASAPADRPVLIEWPQQVVNNKRFSVAASMGALYIWGFADIDHMRGANFGSDVRQFQLGKSQQAICVYSSDAYSSIILIYSPSAGKGGIKASTADGSLQAWILRHPREIKLNEPVHGVWLAEWDKFLAASNEERSKQPGALSLEGTMELTNDAEGLLHQCDVDLHSSKPLPGYMEFLDYGNEQASLEMERNVKAETSEQLNKERKELLTEFDLVRSHPAQKNAQIQGRIYASWGPEFHIVWP